MMTSEEPSIHEHVAASVRKEAEAIHARLGMYAKEEDIFDEICANPQGAFYKFVFHVSGQEAQKRYYLARIQYVMRNLTAVHITSDGDKVAFRMEHRTPDGYINTVNVAPGSVTANGIAAKLISDIVGARKRAVAFAAIMKTKGDKDRANLVISYLTQAEAEVVKYNNRDAHIEAAARAEQAKQIRQHVSSK